MNSVELAQKLWEKYREEGCYTVPDVEKHVRDNAVKRVNARIKLFDEYVFKGLFHKAKMLEITPIKDGPI